ncbi:xanthine dehydrogenase small subunit [Leptolyngbya iicbica]|uniref:Xanthine dehydrogenase small subunit n=2 Tax=Cyanophyceae TaxID=3028117 RepID=A0A4V2E3I8_9CYAN|nr:xanthine dehydrogenase small subunit [Leptolyngbya sp. LK]RZM82590.1 xanthine dehydrogenase small subunit [Leptolyngbya sp. LK]
MPPSVSTTSLQFTLNGEPLCLQEASPTQTLLSYLRQHGYVGTKEGCGDGDCGACTVVMVGADATGQPQYQAVNSCLLPIGSLGGRHIYTVEGIANDRLHPVQQAMVDLGGSQCGYCTPGFIMSLFAGYYSDRVADEVTVEGNLCRCTGYLPIRRAAQRVAAESHGEDDFSQALSQVSLPLAATAYSAQGQQFYRPTQLAEVLDLLQAHPDATLVAGSTDLGLEMSWYRQHYPVMIALEAVAELHQLAHTDDAVTIGAAVPLSQIEEQLRGVFPSLDEMLHWFAARQVRNRATLGGNLGTASPIGDLPPVLLALDATIQVASAAGSREIAIADFFKGYRVTDLRTGEVIVAITIPKTPQIAVTRRLSQSYKIGKRGTDDISIVAAAYRIDLDTQNRVVAARLAYGGVAATPIRAIAVEEWLIGQPWTLATVLAAKEQLRSAFTPMSDLRGSADYRNRLIANLFEKFFVEFNNCE